MLIQQEELNRIIKHYRIEGSLELAGYQRVDPDTVWYYFYDNDDNFYILEASDYNFWACGNDEPPEKMRANYYEDAMMVFEVERWLTSHDGSNESDESGDSEGYLYWASNGEVCVMAKIKGKFSDYSLNNLVKELPISNKVEAAISLKNFVMHEEVSSISRPEWQEVRNVEKAVCDSIHEEMMELAQYFVDVHAASIPEDKLLRCSKDLAMYAQAWAENGGDSIEGKMLKELCDQGRMALYEKRDFPDYFEERFGLVFLFKRYLNYVNKVAGPKFLPRKVIDAIIDEFEVENEGYLMINSMKEFVNDCKIYYLEGESGSEYVLLCRNVRQEDIELERVILWQDFNMMVDKFYPLKGKPDEFYYTYDAPKKEDDKAGDYYFALAGVTY